MPVLTLGHFALLRPWWLLALPLVALLYALSRPRGGLLAGWEKAADPHLLAAMVARGASAAGGRLRAPAILLTLVAGIVALSGPAVRREANDRLRNLDATIVVMDASQDMGAQLREAASAAHDVLAHIGARQAALIVFAGDAYVASALTDSRSAIDDDLFALDDSTVPDPGVRPDRALAAAGRLLDEAHILRGDVVLFSSGGGLSGTAAIRAAAELARAGRRVFTVDAAGRRGTATASAALDAVASAGGGFSVDMLHPERLLAALSGEAIRNTESSIVVSLDWRDLGRLLLVLAAVPLLLGFRKAAVA